MSDNSSRISGSASAADSAERQHCVCVANEWFNAARGLSKESLADVIARERAAAREAALEEAAAGLDKARAEAEEKAREAHAAKQYDNEGLWDFSAACLGIEAKVVSALKVRP